MKKFTVEEIRNYLESQDSFGDALYFLSEDNIEKAQPEIEDVEEDDNPFDYGKYPNWDEHD